MRDTPDRMIEKIDFEFVPQQEGFIDRVGPVRWSIPLCNTRNSRNGKLPVFY